MIIVASSNGKVGISAAMEVLRNGGSAIDAVEAGIRLVESNPDDTTVGLGGIPNLLGQVELDASIMDGRPLSAGAVAAVQGYENPLWKKPGARLWRISLPCLLPTWVG